MNSIVKAVIEAVVALGGCGRGTPALACSPEVARRPRRATHSAGNLAGVTHTR